MNRVLGRWIAVLRMDCGMTRRNLAERLGVPSSTVARWECESENVPAEFLAPLAETLHVPVDDLLALHAQSARRPRTRPAGAAARPQKRVTRYPIGATLADMLELGGAVAWSLCTRVEHRLGKKTYDQLLERFPRDNALQLMLTHHLVSSGADLRKVRLLELGCGLLVTHRTRKTYDGDRERWALILAGDDWLLVLVPQVSLGIPGCPQIYRADFLTLYVDSYGHRHWLDMTVEPQAPTDDAHAECPSLLGIPRFRFEPGEVLREDFGPRFVADIRRYMMSDVVHDRGVTSLRVRQPVRVEAPVLKSRSDAEPGR